MYGDPDVMRRRVGQLREQGVDVRSLADRLVSESDRIPWTGRAADAMRQRIRERATHLRECAAAHEGAADALERHTQAVERLKDTIAVTERKANTLLSDGHDPRLADFAPPPPGHRDWLTVELPGL